MKDLVREDVENLSQIKWIFNGAKKPSDFKKNMLDAIDKLPLTDNLAKKFLKDVRNPNKQKLKEEIISNFEQIFNLIK